MMKIWNWILSFFGFGGKAPTKEENLQKLLDDIGSSTNLDQCRRKAFQAIQKGDRIQPGMRHPYEATIRGDCIIVDTALTEYFNDVLRKLFGTASHLVTRIQNGIGIELAEARAVNVGQKVSGRIAIQTPDIEKLQSELSVARSNLDRKSTRLNSSH